MTTQGMRARSDNAWFARHLRVALTSLYDPSVLRDSPLVELLGLEQRDNPVSALRRALIDAIESLRPLASTPQGTRTWRIYQVLRRRYTEQLPQNKVASDLGLSVRQLQREEKRAREVLADYLWTAYSLEVRVHDLASTSSPPGDRDGSHVRPPTRAQELEWLRSSVPAQETDVGEMIQEILETIAPLVESSQVSVEYAAQETPLRLSLQAPLLRQALLNLVSTAIHCAPRGRTRIQTQVSPPQAYIHVRAIAHPDAAPAQLRECVESLTMAEQLIQLSRGTLEIVPAKDGEIPLPMAEGEVFAAQVTLPLTEQVTVLVIDDNADTLQLFQRYLSGSRYRFVGAQDAQRGLALAEELAPQVVVLDVMMPGRDGWTILGQLREHPKTCDIPVVVCTILPHRELALALGAAAFIRKPVSRAGLLLALDRRLDPLPRRSC